MGPIRTRMHALLDQASIDDVQPRERKKGKKSRVPAPKGGSGFGDDAHASQIITTGTRGKFW